MEYKLCVVFQHRDKDTTTTVTLTQTGLIVEHISMVVVYKMHSSTLPTMVFDSSSLLFSLQVVHHALTLALTQ